MKVLVIGGKGYIGSHCAKALINAGHQVIIFDQDGDENHKLPYEVHTIKGDIRNRNDVDHAMKAAQFDAVMHFAAKIEVKESQIDPGLYYDNNVLGTINILESMRKHEIKSIVFSSTAAVYGNPKETPIPETATIAPINTYGKTKVMVEQMIQDYHSAYGFSAVIFRYFNASGASVDGSLGENHQPESHLIPIFIDKIIKSQPVTINGNDYKTKDGTAIRDYVHVEDIAQAHVLGVEYTQFEKKCEVFNIGSGAGFSINEVVKSLETVLDKKIEVSYGPRREGDPDELVADAQKIHSLLGWTPEYSTLETIIQTAVHWYKKQK